MQQSKTLNNVKCVSPCKCSLHAWKLDAFTVLQREGERTGQPLALADGICTLWFQECSALSSVSPHLDWREVVKEEYSRHVLPLLYVSSLEVLCYRVLIAVYGVVPYITVYGWHHLGKGSMYFCLHCNAWTLLFH